MTIQHLQLVNQPEEQNIARRNKISGGGDGGNMNDNERIARLETKVDHIESDIRDIKTDIRDMRREFRDELNNVREKMDANFKWLMGVMITSGLSAVTSIVSVVLHFVVTA